jgi:hypothetical protein
VIVLAALVIQLDFCYLERRMNSWVSRARALLCLLALGSFAKSSEAIIFESTSNTTFNTTAPTGALTNSGWQYEGFWEGSFLVTPIAPTFFIAAIHIGGAIGGTVFFNGSPIIYHTVAFWDCPNSDLRIWQVAETFPSYAPLYTGSNEVNKLCVVFGRGTQRGDSVTIGGQLKGWKWGIGDAIERWGENVVTTIVTDPSLGQFLAATFDRTGTNNECTLSDGDSSGGVFIQNGSTWELAAINYAATGLYSLDGTTNTQFNGAMVDEGGLYVSDGIGGWTFVTNQFTDIPGYFLSSRVSAHIAWINSVINFEPGSDMQITNIAPAGADMHISLATGSNRLYLVQSTTDLVTGTWTTVTNNLAGNGGVVIAIDPGATTQPKRFYRVQLLQ